MPARPYLLLLLLGLSWACSRDMKVATTPEAPLEVSPAFLDLGSVTFGERAEGSFTLRNPASEPLRILRIGPFSCSCASASLELPDRAQGGPPRRLDGGRLELTLAPGERAIVRFALDTSRYRQPTSRKVGSIPVVFAEGPGMTLQWGADIWTPFQCEPWLTDMGEVGVRQRPQGFVVVTSHDTLDFEVEVDQVVNGWHVISDRVSSEDSVRKSFRLTFTAPEELPEGPFRQDFVFQSNLQGAPPIRFSVQGRAVPDLFLSPARLILDPTRGRMEAEVRVVQRALGASLGELSLTDAPAPLRLIEQEVVDEKQRLLHFAWQGEAPAAPLTQELQILTGDEEQPSLKLLLSVLPARGDS